MLDTLTLINDVVINDNDETDPSGVLRLLKEQDMFSTEDAIGIIRDNLDKISNEA